MENYIILDDCQFDYDGCGIADKLVKTNQTEGLTEKEVKKTCEILANNSIITTSEIPTEGSFKLWKAAAI